MTIDQLTISVSVEQLLEKFKEHVERLSKEFHRPGFGFLRLSRLLPAQQQFALIRKKCSTNKNGVF